jgi:pimeloyl-ACP methyl ester carboxylesterase
MRTIAAVTMAVLGACAADPGVELVAPVDAGTDRSVFLLHGDGELGADVLDRWQIDARAPDDTGSDALISELARSGQRSIVLGQGAGASMAYTIACARPDLVAAIVMLSGVAHAEPCVSGQVVSVLTAHGTVDSHTPYSTAQATFERAQTIARCADEAYVASPALGATVEALACVARDEGRVRTAEHWRVIGWDHNPELGAEWGDAVETWLLGVE